MFPVPTNYSISQCARTQKVFMTPAIDSSKMNTKKKTCKIFCQRKNYLIWVRSLQLMPSDKSIKAENVLCSFISKVSFKKKYRPFHGILKHFVLPLRGEISWYFLICLDGIPVGCHLLDNPHMGLKSVVNPQNSTLSKWTWINLKCILLFAAVPCHKIKEMSTGDKKNRDVGLFG